jgi:hypothetical protein
MQKTKWIHLRECPLNQAHPESDVQREHAPGKRIGESRIGVSAYRQGIQAFFCKFCGKKSSETLLAMLTIFGRLLTGQHAETPYADRCSLNLRIAVA